MSPVSRIFLERDRAVIRGTQRENLHRQARGRTMPTPAGYHEDRAARNDRFVPAFVIVVQQCDFDFTIEKLKNSYAQDGLWT